MFGENRSKHDKYRYIKKTYLERVSKKKKNMIISRDSWS